MRRRPKSQSSGEATVAVGGSGTAPAVVEVPEAKEKGPVLDVPRLRGEIAELRATLAQRIAELRALGGEESGRPSDTVRKVLELLEREEGATKAQLVEATGAKEAYVAALLNRILPSKGYSISSNVLPGAKASPSYRRTSCPLLAPCAERLLRFALAWRRGKSVCARRSRCRPP